MLHTNLLDFFPSRSPFVPSVLRVRPTIFLFPSLFTFVRDPTSCCPVVPSFACLYLRYRDERCYRDWKKVTVTVLPVRLPACLPSFLPSFLPFFLPSLDNLRHRLRERFAADSIPSNGWYFVLGEFEKPEVGARIGTETNLDTAPRQTKGRRKYRR